MKQIGKPLNRLEGHLKVSGAAKYSGDYNVADLLYGYVVNSSIPKGKIVKIDTSAAEKIVGVEKIFTHQNRPSIAWFDLLYADMDAPPGSPFRPLQNENIKFSGQPIALVVANSFEAAREAASLIRVDYHEGNFKTGIEENLSDARPPKMGMATLLKPPPPKPEGDFEGVYAAAPFKASGRFIHGAEHHNPMELFTTTVLYKGKGKLDIYDKTQGTINCQLYVANVFGLHYKNVRVISPFVGGAFGSGLRPQYQLFLSVMASLNLKRHIKVTLDRSQMFTLGHRPPSVQQTRFSANDQGMVTALSHSAVGETSQFEDYVENVVNWSPMLYPCNNTLLEHNLVALDTNTPTDMRAPGGSTGMHAIEVTMDKLAYKLGIDPLELRLINYSIFNKVEDKPYTSKELKACYLQGAEKFGWTNRSPLVRSMRKGNKLIGYGMASGIWDAMHLPARAEAMVTSDGKLHVKSAVTDIGVGTLTVMTQIAADEFGLPMEAVVFSYGDSKLPFAPIQGGSFTTATVGTAIVFASKALKKKLLRIAKKHDNNFKKAELESIFFVDGNIGYGNYSIPLSELVAANGGKPIRTTNIGYPHALRLRNYARGVHSAAFVEVEVDEELGTVTVTRALTAVAAGRIINPKTARSQILGGMVWGISKALMEESVMDHRLGRYINQNFAEYHIPVHADIGELDVIFIEEQDSLINELGIKGVGEVGLVAMPPAIANAIYHATGKRINNLPIHFDQLI